MMSSFQPGGFDSTRKPDCERGAVFLLREIGFLCRRLFKTMRSREKKLYPISRQSILKS
jgi:hypothetical protein